MATTPLTNPDPMDAAAEEAADILKVLSNPGRLRLLCALVPQDRTVSESQHQDCVS